MKFKVFVKTGERHFNHDDIDDYDGDEGYYADIDVGYEDVKKDLVSIIVDDCYSKDLNTAHEQLCHVVSKFIDDNGLWDDIIENYHDALQNLYEESENE